MRGRAGSAMALPHGVGLREAGAPPKRLLFSARRERLLEPDRRRGLIAGEIPRQSKPEGSLRGWPIEWNLECLPVGHGRPHSRTDVLLLNRRPQTLPLSRINTRLSPVQM